MKALVLEEVGRLAYKEVPTPKPKQGEVLVKVKACGICSSDFDRCLKTGTYHFPTIPGHEFSGEIVALGPGVEGGWLGKLVAVFPLLPCKKCDQCNIEAYARCRNYNYFGSRCDGAFAEYIAVPIWNLQPFTEDLDCKVAALCEPAAVAYHSVQAGEIKSGDSICVVGTGTIGLMAGLFAKEIGGNVTFVCRSERKKGFLTSFGFDSFVDAGDSGGREFDVVIECVGSDNSLKEAIVRTKSSGALILVGNPDGNKALDRKSYWKILRSELTIKGVWNSSYRSSDNEWRKVLSILTLRQDVFARLITSTFSLSEGVEAFHKIKTSPKIEIKGMFINE